MEVRAQKNCPPFYARFCKVIRIEPVMGEVLPGKGRRVSIPIDPLNTPLPPPPPRPTPHPLFPHLKYDRFWPWNLAFPGSLFLVISKKWHRNFKVVKFPQVANSLPVCGERNWIQVPSIIRKVQHHNFKTKTERKNRKMSPNKKGWRRIRLSC